MTAHDAIAICDERALDFHREEIDALRVSDLRRAERCRWSAATLEQFSRDLTDRLEAERQETNWLHLMLHITRTEANKIAGRITPAELWGDPS